MEAAYKKYKIETFHDIIKALKENPELLEEIRRIILTEELIELPKKFEQFLQNEFRPLKKDVDILKEDVAVLKQDVAVLKQDVAVLKQDVAVLKQDVAVLKQDVAVLKQDVADLKGDNFVRVVRERAPSYFGRLIRKCKVVSIEEFAEVLEEAVDKKTIEEEEKNEALRVDVVVTGVLKTEEDQKVIIAGEVSVTADANDVERAYKRAKIIGKAFGVSSMAVVIGRKYTEGAIDKSNQLGVIII